MFPNDLEPNVPNQNSLSFKNLPLPFAHIISDNGTSVHPVNGPGAVPDLSNVCLPHEISQHFLPVLFLNTLSFVSSSLLPGPPSWSLTQPPSCVSFRPSFLPQPTPPPFETGWDLGPFAAVLAPGRTSPPATNHRETVREEK